MKLPFPVVGGRAALASGLPVYMPVMLARGRTLMRLRQYDVAPPAPCGLDDKRAVYGDGIYNTRPGYRANRWFLQP